MRPTMLLTIGIHCVLMLALAACAGQVTGGEKPRVGDPSPAAGSGVKAAAASDQDPTRVEPDARGRAQPTGTSSSQQARQDRDRAIEDARNARIDDRQPSGDDADAGATDSDERDGGAEADGGAPNGDRGCERRCCRGERAGSREHSGRDHAATGDRAD